MASAGIVILFLLFKELLAKGYSFPLKAVSGVNLLLFSMSYSDLSHSPYTNSHIISENTH